MITEMNYSNAVDERVIVETIKVMINYNYSVIFSKG